MLEAGYVTPFPAVSVDWPEYGQQEAERKLQEQLLWESQQNGEPY